MFGLGLQEMLIILIVALIISGPAKLPLVIVILAAAFSIAVMRYSDLQFLDC